MNDILSSYLVHEHTQCDRSRALSARFALPAITLLMGSDAYRLADWRALRDLAVDLKMENLSTIELARKHPDVFHPNVVHSRQAENRIYDAVIQIVGQSSVSKAA